MRLPEHHWCGSWEAQQLLSGRLCDIASRFDNGDRQLRAKPLVFSLFICYTVRKEGYYGLLERYVFWRRSWGCAWLQRQPESRFAAHGHVAGQSPAGNRA